MTKQVTHDASGKFFIRNENASSIHWRLARYDSSYSDSVAIKDIINNGYMRHVAEDGKFIYEKVSDLLNTSQCKEIMIAIAAHMGHK
jgi:hypothetical protein